MPQKVNLIERVLVYVLKAISGLSHPVMESHNAQHSPNLKISALFRGQLLVTCETLS
jgi:hypothetical protein